MSKIICAFSDLGNVSKTFCLGLVYPEEVFQRDEYHIADDVLRGALAGNQVLDQRDPLFRLMLRRHYESFVKFSK